MDRKGTYLNISNILTFSRILLSPVLCYFILSKNYNISFFLFLVLSITDFLDGFFARRQKHETKLGKVLDPIADKILTFSVMSCFLAMGMMNVWAFIILLFRDFLISAFRITLSNKNKICGANKSGKIKTLFQVLFISMTLLPENVKKISLISFLCPVFLWSSVLFSIISLMIHISNNENTIKEIIH